jgi:hypothetical protein
MEPFEGRLRRVGNSLGILVPKDVLQALRAREGDSVKVALWPASRTQLEGLLAVAGSMPGIGPFRRERKDRY